MLRTRLLFKDECAQHTSQQAASAAPGKRAKAAPSKAAKPEPSNRAERGPSANEVSAKALALRVVLGIMVASLLINVTP